MPEHEQTGDWDGHPPMGSLPRLQAAALAAALATHTRTPERCWFAVWEGWANLQAERNDAPMTLIPDCHMRLFTGSVYDAGTDYGQRHYQSANLWWPDDHSWVVSTDVDDVTTYVGGSREAIRRVLAATELEALEVPVGHTQRYVEDSENDIA
jgi:hypothetical protein